MRTVWKFTMPYQLDAVATWSIPEGARLVHVAPDVIEPGSLSQPALSAWFEVDTEADREIRVFEVFGTGHSIPDGAGEYRGTIREGWLVIHLYERTFEPEGQGA